MLRLPQRGALLGAIALWPPALDQVAVTVEGLSDVVEEGSNSGCTPNIAMAEEPEIHRAFKDRLTHAKEPGITIAEEAGEARDAYPFGDGLMKKDRAADSIDGRAASLWIPPPVGLRGVVWIVNIANARQALPRRPFRGASRPSESVVGARDSRDAASDQG